MAVPDLRSRIRGCLLGGAVGDALGAPVEFHTLAAIRNVFGPEGVTTLLPVFRRTGAITDDTQMTLFTAEGLLRARNRRIATGEDDVVGSLWAAYQRWLVTQSERAFHPGMDDLADGWLLTLPALYARRAPGQTCLGALGGGQPGSAEAPINDSKGCGGVMRAGPIGLVPGDAFDLGYRSAALTHGHPSGYLAAGVLACVIQEILGGAALREALDTAVSRLAGRSGHEECRGALERAFALAERAEGTAVEVESLGAGWVAEEALAIGVFACLVESDPERVLPLAVTHGGDSDSTGSIAGQIAGVLYGEEALPAQWLVSLELKDEIAELAGDLVHCFHLSGGGDQGSLYRPDRYPPG